MLFPVTSKIRIQLLSHFVKKTELIEYVNFMKRKRQQSVFKDLELASETSLGFWDNERDDEAWNNEVRVGYTG